MTDSQQTAARLDAAIDSLLRDGRGPSAVGGDDELQATARRLRDALPRFHPRFGFEELLAGRLVAPGQSRMPSSWPGASTGQPGEPIPFPRLAGSEVGNVGVLRRHRGLLAGGIASGVSIAIPLAGAAIVVWKRGRSSGGAL